MSRVVIPNYPTGRAEPIVVRCDVIADNTVLGSYFMVVPVECDRGAHHTIEARFDLAAVHGDVRQVIAGRLALERKQLSDRLAEAGMRDAALLVLRTPMDLQGESVDKITVVQEGLVASLVASDPVSVQLVRVRGCEYVVVSSDKGVAVAHAADCSNANHQIK